MSGSRYRLLSVAVLAVMLVTGISAPAFGVARTVLGELFSSSG